MRRTVRIRISVVCLTFEPEIGLSSFQYKSTLLNLAIFWWNKLHSFLGNLTHSLFKNHFVKSNIKFDLDHIFEYYLWRLRPQGLWGVPELLGGEGTTVGCSGERMGRSGYVLKISWISDYVKGNLSHRKLFWETITWSNFSWSKLCFITWSKLC
jgi:hypothetical protein